MDVKKWIPWNWFKKEEEAGGVSVPVMRSTTQDPDHILGGSIARFHRDIEQLFNQAFRGLGMTPFGSRQPLLTGANGGIFKPTLDLGATDQAYTITVEIPGVDQDDVKLEVSGNTLTIRGEKHQETEDKGKNYYRMERSYGAFQRMLSLPEDVDQDNIKATFKNGILTIGMPRMALPKTNVRQIEVQPA